MRFFKTTILGSILGIAFSATALAQAEPAAAGQAEPSPAVWKATKGDADVYLLGTFHILPPELEWRSPEIEAAIADTSIVYFEVDASSSEAQSKTLSIVMTEGFGSPGYSLADSLDQEDSAKLKEIVSSLGMPFNGVDPMRPWYAFLTLSVQFIVQQGYTPGAGVDTVLQAETKTLGKDVRYIESIEEQLGFFTGLTPEQEKALLTVTLRRWDEQAAEFSNLLTAWLIGDAASINEQMNASMGDIAPEVFDLLIKNRNIAWAEEIDDVVGAGDKKILVAVGAAHLVGEHSVQKYLSEKGFSIARFNAANDN